MIRAFATALTLALAGAVPAAAEQVEVTAQAKAARADFLLKATPPGPAAVICLVGTGVDPNADTPGVIDRISLEGPIFDTSPTSHSTRMAMYIGAPSNGFGMVGIWPAARIVSIRANIAGQDAFTPAGFNFGLKQCDKDATFYGIKVAVLTMSAETPLTADETEAIGGTVAAARAHGLNVVIAAGDNSGRGPGVPANFPGAFSIAAASSSSGGLCPFSATGALLVAPGCTLDGADATGQPTTTDQGTGYSAAIVAASLAALRTWRPDLTPDEADRLLSDTAAAGHRLDLGAAFTAAGFGALVPPVVTPSPAPPAAPPPPVVVKRRLAKPKFTVRASGHGAKRTITVRLKNRPKGAKASVRVYVRGRHGTLKRAATRTRSSSVIRIRVRSWRRVTAGFSDPTGQRLPSLSAILNAKR
jgi:hypothetical protein